MGFSSPASGGGGGGGGGGSTVIAQGETVVSGTTYEHDLADDPTRNVTVRAWWVTVDPDVIGDIGLVIGGGSVLEDQFNYECYWNTPEDYWSIRFRDRAGGDPTIGWQLVEFPK